MKNLIYMMLASMLLLTSCFEDEGNYDYSEMNPPHWLINTIQPKPIYVRQGQVAVLDARDFFVWDTDSAQREKEVEYEWVVNNHVVGHGKVLKIPTEKLMELAEVKEYSSSIGTFGTFNVVEKSTGVKYMSKIIVWFRTKYSDYNWIIMTDKGGQAGISALLLDYGSNNQIEGYELIKDAYADANPGSTIPGTPISMNWAYDKHISAQGSITVITDRGAFELCASDLTLHGQIDDEQFLEGLPQNFEPVARADCDGNSTTQPATFLATKDGLIYSRVMSLNYLGGKYLSEPYYVDEKGYKVTKFGNTLYGNPMIPCYDEKNRRIMIASVYYNQITDEDGEKQNTSTTRLKPLTNPSYYQNVQNMPEGTKVLYLGLTNHASYHTRGCLHYSMVYNLPNEAHTRITDFAVYVNTSNTNSGDYYSGSFLLENVPQLDEHSCILSSGVTSNRTYPATEQALRTLYYTVGNKIYYVERSGTYYPFGHTLKDFTLPRGVEITSRITYLAMAHLECNELLVGCENGDLFMFDITSLNAPKLMLQDNVGGKVMSARQLGERRPANDKFNY